MKRTLAFAISAQAISIVILLLLSTQFFRQLNELSDYTNKVEHTYLTLNQLAQVRSQIKDAETSARGYVISEQPAFLNLLKISLLLMPLSVCRISPFRITEPNILEVAL